MSRRAVAVVVAGALAGLGIAAGSSAGSSERWLPVDFLKTVRHRYPAFVQVTPLGFDAKGRLYWTARERGVVIPNQREYTDGTLQHVFVWNDGKTRDLGSLGQSDNHAIAVNASGEIAVTRSVGPFTGPIGTHIDLPPDRAFLWRHGRLISLGTLGGGDSNVTAIDASGDAVGRSETHGSDIRSSHAFIWRNGKMTDLGTLGGNSSEALAVDDGGRVVGQSSSARHPRGDLTRAFVWQDGKMTDLGVRMNLNYWASLRIGADATIVGTTGLGDAPSGFVWRDGKLTVLGPIAGQATTATGVGGGRVVGGTTTSIGEFRAHAFVWQNGRVTVLPGPRLPWAPIVSIDPTGTRIFAVSSETAGLRTRMIIWKLR